LLCGAVREVPLDQRARELVLRMRDVAPVFLEHMLARLAGTKVLALRHEVGDSALKNLYCLGVFHLTTCNGSGAQKDVKHGKDFVKTTQILVGETMSPPRTPSSPPPR
jgi:hypothetical protein